MQACFPRWVRTSTPRAREIVLEILKSSSPATLHSRDIYQHVLKDYSQERVPVPPPIQNPRFSNESKPPPEPPHPDHPIRSYTYLKSVILAEMARRNEITKVHMMRDPTPEELARKNERPSNAGRKNKRPSGPPVVFNVKGMIDQWGWAVKTADDLDAVKREQLRVQKATAGQKMLDAKKSAKEQRKAFKEQWGHLNVRRQRARVGKLQRDEEWARVLDRGREEGRAEAQRMTPS